MRKGKYTKTFQIIISYKFAKVWVVEPHVECNGAMLAIYLFIINKVYLYLNRIKANNYP